MSYESIFERFNAIPAPYRMLCVDAAAVGCYLVNQGQDEAGRKLVRTALLAAGIEPSVADELVDNFPESLGCLAVHAEIRCLF